MQSALIAEVGRREKRMKDEKMGMWIQPKGSEETVDHLDAAGLVLESFG